LITEAALQERTSRDLAQMARKKGVQGWHSMRKPQLVKALYKLAKDKGKQNKKLATAKAKSVADPDSLSNGTPLISAQTRPKKTARASKSAVVTAESEIAKQLRSSVLNKRNLETLLSAKLTTRAKPSPNVTASC